MIVVYGSVFNGVHKDTSNTLKGAKRYATINNIDNVSKRTAYFVTIEFVKKNNKWIKFKY